MTGSVLLVVAAVALLGAGTLLLLPHRIGTAKPRSVHVLGAVLAGLGLVLLAGLWAGPESLITRVFFVAFGLCAIGGGVLMVSSRNPVYNALWFAVVLLSSAGLFLLVGAQFLAAGTVIVYAGAIVVTFLFVIMLAQAEGHAVYDRMARSPIATTIVAFLLLGCLSLAITQVGGSAGSSAGGAATDAARLTTTGLARRAIASGDRAAALVIERAVGPTARMPIVDSDLAARGMPPPHVAGLGGTLYTDHLLAVEIVGAILFVALVGAASIATPRPTARRDRRGGGARAGSLSEL